MIEEMNNNGKMNGMKILIAVLAIIIVAGLLTQFIYLSMNDGQDPQDLGYTRFDNDTMSRDINDLPYENLSEEEEAGILFMREEEKLARDVYLTLFDAWSKNIFKNIAESENTHTTSIKLLIDKYSLSDPFTEERGTFNNSILQDLYDSLVENGSRSYLDALMVGDAVTDLKAAQYCNILFYGRGERFSEDNVPWSEGLTGLVDYLSGNFDLNSIG